MDDLLFAAFILVPTAMIAAPLLIARRRGRRRPATTTAVSELPASASREIM